MTEGLSPVEIMTSTVILAKEARADTENPLLMDLSLAMVRSSLYLTQGNIALAASVLLASFENISAEDIETDFDSYQYLWEGLSPLMGALKLYQDSCFFEDGSLSYVEVDAIVYIMDYLDCVFSSDDASGISSCMMPLVSSSDGNLLDGGDFILLTDTFSRELKSISNSLLVLYGSFLDDDSLAADTLHVLNYFFSAVDSFDRGNVYKAVAVGSIDETTYYDKSFWEYQSAFSSLNLAFSLGATFESIVASEDLRAISFDLLEYAMDVWNDYNFTLVTSDDPFLRLSQLISSYMNFQVGAVGLYNGGFSAFANVLTTSEDGFDDVLATFQASASLSDDSDILSDFNSFYTNLSQNEYQTAATYFQSGVEGIISADLDGLSLIEYCEKLLIRVSLFQPMSNDLNETLLSVFTSIEKALLLQTFTGTVSDSSVITEEVVALAISDAMTSYSKVFAAEGFEYASAAAIVCFNYLSLAVGAFSNNASDTIEILEELLVGILKFTWQKNSYLQIVESINYAVSLVQSSQNSDELKDSYFEFLESTSLNLSDDQALFLDDFYYIEESQTASTLQATIATDIISLDSTDDADAISILNDVSSIFDSWDGSDLATAITALEGVIDDASGVFGTDVFWIVGKNLQKAFDLIVYTISQLDDASAYTDSVASLTSDLFNTVLGGTTALSTSRRLDYDESGSDSDSDSDSESDSGSDSDSDSDSESDSGSDSDNDSDSGEVPNVAQIVSAAYFDPVVNNNDQVDYDEGLPVAGYATDESFDMADVPVAETGVRASMVGSDGGDLDDRADDFEEDVDECELMLAPVDFYSGYNSIYLALRDSGDGTENVLNIFAELVTTGDVYVSA